MQITKRMIQTGKYYLLGTFKNIILFLMCLMSFSCNYSKKSNSYIELLKDKEESEILKSLGKPNQSETIIFFKGVSLLEYQSSLYDLIKLDSNEKIEIKEKKWEKEDQTIVFWFKQKNKKWIAIDYLEWNHKKISY